MERVDISDKPSPHGLKNKALRVLWRMVWLLLYRPSLRPMYAWRRFLLRLFGARISRLARPHASARVWAPWNLHMDDYATLSPDVDCYNVAPVRIGSHSTVSQYCFLCTASHDFEHPNMLLTSAPIDIGSQVWVCADVFVGPGVTIGDGTVVGARSSVFRDLPKWKVCVGSPARPVRDREMRCGTEIEEKVRRP